MAKLLPPGKHVIKPAKGFEGPTCGLVPLNGPATITTQGLKWNLGMLQHATDVTIKFPWSHTAATCTVKQIWLLQQLSVAI